MGRTGDMTPPLRWRLGVAGGMALVVLLLDQLTKFAVRAVGDALHVTVIPGVIDFMFVRNIGAAFSMGEGHGVAFAALALLSPAAREVDATAELNARDEARAKRKAKQRGERARKIRERNER